MTPFEFIIVAMAVHRVTHLVVEDSFPPVARLRRRLSRGGGALSYLVNCFWCSSVWTSAAAVGAMYVWTPAHWRGVPAPFVVGAALSTAATFVESVVERIEVGILRAELDTIVEVGG